VELAKDCVRTCHVLKTLTERRDVDLCGSGNRQIEDLGRCVNRTQSSSLTITNDFRIVSRIASAVGDRANRPHDLREYHPGPTKEYLFAWRTEVLETLRAFDVCITQVQHPCFLNYLRGTWSEAVSSRSAKSNNTCMGPSARNPQHLLPSWFVIASPPLCHCLLTVRSM